MEQSLLYVSIKSYDPADDLFEIRNIVNVANQRNAVLGITGALIATAEYFAQILEGQPDHLQALMDSIASDPRHASVRVVDTTPITSRYFPDWSLLYSGPSSFIARQIEPLIRRASAPDAASADTLVYFMRRFRV